MRRGSELERYDSAAEQAHARLLAQAQAPMPRSSNSGELDATDIIPLALMRANTTALARNLWQVRGLAPC